MSVILAPGTQERYITETTVGAGSTSKEGSTRTDSILVSLWVPTVTSGTLSVKVYTLSDSGKEVVLITFPILSAGTTELLLRKSAVTLQRFRIEATYTGVVEYEIYVRAITGAGESSARILGSSNWAVSQKDIPTSSTELIPSSLTDRSGLVIKNWSATATVYIGEDSSKAQISLGYPLAPRDALALDIAAGASVWAISDSGVADIRIAQSGG